MKIKSVLLTLISLSIFSFSLAAQESNPLKFSITTDMAYYPKSDYIAGGDHFAPLTGAYSGLEGRVTGAMDYTIPVPLGEHWLLASANIGLNASLELSPVSVKPGISVSFTPLPFLVFSTGAQAGTGWNLAGLHGMAYLTHKGSDFTYADYSPFQTWFVKWYAQGTFQFDTGALIPGDWTHFQIMYTYQIYYAGLTSAKNTDVWMWQCSGNKTNGWNNYQNLVLAYQMPLVLSRIGVLTEFEGHYSNSDYAFEKYKGSFETISISPLMQFTLGSKDSLSVLFGFSSRRSYSEIHTDSNSETYLTYSGREWFFNRIALSWSHNF